MWCISWAKGLDRGRSRGDHRNSASDRTVPVTKGHISLASRIRIWSVSYQQSGGQSARRG